MRKLVVVMLVVLALSAIAFPAAAQIGGIIRPNATAATVKSK